MLISRPSLLLQRYLQQSIEPQLGAFKANSACVPTCYFILAKAAGYLKSGPGSDLVTFCAELDWEHNHIQERGGWVRPYLARELRARYGIASVSWHVDGNTPTAQDLTRMQQAGYLEAGREVTFFGDHVVGRSLEDLVREGYPVMVGMVAGFAHNTNSHTVIVSNWDDSGVEIIDPDERNVRRTYEASYILESINTTGGGFTIVLLPDVRQ